MRVPLVHSALRARLFDKALPVAPRALSFSKIHYSFKGGSITMAFAPKNHKFNASIKKATIGTEGKSVEIGGGCTLPFYTFDAPADGKPKIGVDISDLGLVEGWNLPEIAKFYEGCSSVVDMAKKAAAMPGASFVCLHLESADPNGADKPIAEAVATAKAVADAIDVPLAIKGTGNAERDNELFQAVSAELGGKNILALSAVEENYKTVGLSVAMAGGHKVAAESAVDINLAKQLNVLLSQLNVPATSIVMNLGTSAAGYGYEYLSSTLDRVRDAALGQGDDQLQMPICIPCSGDAWGVKESVTPDEEAPNWAGSTQEQRGIEMEITTAMATITSGADAVIMRHPASIKAVSEIIDALLA